MLMPGQGDSAVAESDGIEDLIGAEAGGSESDREVSGADAVAMAVAIEQARHDPELSRKVGAYVDEQRVLALLQVKHFDEQHQLAIAAAKRKRLSDRLRIGLQLLIAVVAVGIVIGFSAMLWGALTDRSIVIDAASVPADLADQGFTGQAIAKQILDRIAEINASSSTARAADSYASAWGNDIKLEIPETGISIGELSRVLHGFLGHPTHIGSEVTHSAGAVTVRIRVGDQYSVESAGPEVNLAALVQDAATKLFAKTQPYRYGFFLYVTGNSDRAAEVFRQLAVFGPASERVWALHGLAIAADSNRKSIAFEQQALDLDPKFVLSAATIATMNFHLSHDELGLSETTAVIAAEASGSDSTLSRLEGSRTRSSAAVRRDQAVGDYQGMIASATKLADDSVSQSTGTQIFAWRARIQALIQLHDISAATNALELLPPAATDYASMQILLLQTRLAAERGDWQSTILTFEGAKGHLAALSQRDREELSVALYPLLAEAYAHVGRDTDANELLAAIPTDVYDGYRARGRVATLRRDYTNGEVAFGNAVREGPSIPRAYLDWGDLLAAKGDPAAALAKYAEASRRGPNWADPLKAWGDLLAKQGKTKAALEKYDAALKRAPNWTQLKDAHDAAASQKS
jgi:tetratricopeptide (TPR) repeat protein